MEVDVVKKIEELVRDPWWVRADDRVEGDGNGKAVVRVLVPRIEPVVKENLVEVVEEDGGGVRGSVGDGEEGTNGGTGSAQAKRVVLQRRAVAASQAAEDYVRKLETGIAVDVSFRYLLGCFIDGFSVLGFRTGWFVKSLFVSGVFFFFSLYKP